MSSQNVVLLLSLVILKLCSAEPMGSMEITYGFRVIFFQNYQEITLKNHVCTNK